MEMPSAREGWLVLTNNVVAIHAHLQERGVQKNQVGASSVLSVSRL
jgi:hypothetical protein